jgi:hypothetical protein
MHTQATIPMYEFSSKPRLPDAEDKMKHSSQTIAVLADYPFLLSNEPLSATIRLHVTWSQPAVQHLNLNLTAPQLSLHHLIEYFASLALPRGTMAPTFVQSTFLLSLFLSNVSHPRSLLLLLDRLQKELTHDSSFLQPLLRPLAEEALSRPQNSLGIGHSMDATRT